MSENLNNDCPECVDRRDFVRVLGGTAVTLTGLEFVRSNNIALAQPAATPPAAPRAAKPAEALIRELFQGLSDAQKRDVVMPWNHRRPNTNIDTRLGMYNAAFGRKINEAYTPAQQELVGRILRSISSDEDGYRRITRNGTFDASGSLGNCGAYIFGDPSGTGQYSWVFAGHHLTVRCDGNSEADTAFGGPMYYGHSPDGYSNRNCFFYQTQAVKNLFEALDGNQRRQAVIVGRNPGEQAASVQFRNDNYPGLRSGDFTRDQKQLVERVMREVLSPYRREDADEVMDIVRRNGGMDRIHVAFYKDRDAGEDTHWNFWRLEGPGFVWNYRVMPHVHTFVNIAVRRPANS